MRIDLSHYVARPNAKLTTQKYEKTKKPKYFQDNAPTRGTSAPSVIFYSAVHLYNIMVSAVGRNS